MLLCQDHALISTESLSEPDYDLILKYLKNQKLSDKISEIAYAIISITVTKTQFSAQSIECSLKLAIKGLIFLVCEEFKLKNKKKQKSGDKNSKLNEKEIRFLIFNAL